MGGSAVQLSASQHDPNILWYPQAKVKIARLKLEGYNSSYIMIREIESTAHYSDKEKRRAMEILIRGKSNSIRRNALDKCETVDQQIDCLIDHATDETILSLSFQVRVHVVSIKLYSIMLSIWCC